ncbi:MAG: hypothetical protein JWM80_2269 [Cyanobacteria bacterium RYN_339]|nr:hypothetical protein [Cyanobacteria bacterium RYN_339]
MIGLLLAAALAAPPVHQVASVDLPPGALRAFADYMNVDAERHLLYVGYTGMDQVVAIDLRTNKVMATVPGLPRVHAMVPVPGLGLGFASVGGKAEVAVVDLKQHAVVGRIPAGEGPDAILYDAPTGQVYVGNHKGNSATLIDPVARKAIATIPLGGAPEYAQADPASGLVYQNLEDTNELVVVNPRRHQVTARYPLAPGEGPTGLALDAQHGRLFAACDNELLVVLDATTGRRVATAPIGQGVDFVAYDPGLRRIYTANGKSGDMTVIGQQDADHYQVLATIKTFDHAHALALDPATHRIYVVHGSQVAVYEATP